MGHSIDDSDRLDDLALFQATDAIMSNKTGSGKDDLQWFKFCLERTELIAAFATSLRLLWLPELAAVALHLKHLKKVDHLCSRVAAV